MRDIDDHGLAHDLRAMTGLANRRRALRWFTGAGTAAVLAAGDGVGSSSTATISGSMETGYTATAVIGIAR